LSQRHRVIVFEMPGFGQSPENTRTGTSDELGATMLSAMTALGIERFNLMATSFGARVSFLMMLRQPDRVDALVLESPDAIRPPGHQPPAGTPEEIARVIYWHPERHGPYPRGNPVLQAKHRALVGRLRGPDRDALLEARMRDLPTPTLVLFGTLDRLMPPEMGRHYKKILPNCHLVFVYTRDTRSAPIGRRRLRRDGRFPTTSRSVRHQSCGNADPSLRAGPLSRRRHRRSHPGSRLRNSRRCAEESDRPCQLIWTPEAVERQLPTRSEAGGHRRLHRSGRYGADEHPIRFRHHLRSRPVQLNTGFLNRLLNIDRCARLPANRKT
jgi:hypothetical protein